MRGQGVHLILLEGEVGGLISLACKPKSLFNEFDIL